MNRIHLLFVLITLFSFTMSNAQKTTVAVDIEKYAKTWYEIARFPHRFEKGLTNVSATYSIISENKISVLNKGIRSNNKTSQIKGVAWIPNKKETGKLKVRFFWPFAAPYWIHYVDEKYSVAIVGGPGNHYLWILADKPFIDNEIYNELIQKAKEMGYTIENLEKVNQK
ncbi:MAG TPA: lipocalin family protein [Bacteroidales bacterium]|nr:lipocalin family protein [Bacteroidales bacterium]